MTAADCNSSNLLSPEHALGSDGEPQAALLARAKDALRSAWYDHALTLVAQSEDWQEPLNEEGVLVRVEILTRREPVSALAELARLRDSFISPAGRFAYLIGSGKAYGNARNFEAAAAMFADAATLAPRLDNQAIALLAYHQGRLKWLRRSFEPHCSELQVAFEHGDADLKVRTLLLRSFLHAGLQAYDEQISDLRAALKIANASPGVCDISFVALVIQALLRVAFETCHREGIIEGEAAHEKLPWTADIQVERFAATRTLAWDAFLQGHSARAQWLFKDSKEIAPTPAWKVMAHLDRAYVARMNLNEIWANEELLSAHKLARSVAWVETRGEERNVLMILAILFAETDMAQAQLYVSMYIGIGMENINPIFVSNDRRSYASEQYASGRVQQMLGNLELAQKSLENSYTIFAGCKHQYRAALCAWGLFEVTGDSQWHERALKHAEHFPKSPVYERIMDAAPAPDARDPFAGMTSMQREIALALGHGMDIPDLADRFGRSAEAISKQVNAVYAALGVGTRNGLREELARRGALI